MYQIVLFVARKSQGSLKIKKFKINKIVNKSLLTGDKFMAKSQLRHTGFTYSTCGTFTKHRGRIKKFRETDDLMHLYKNEIDKACFAHDTAYSDSKVLV